MGQIIKATIDDQEQEFEMVGDSDAGRTHCEHIITRDGVIKPRGHGHTQRVRLRLIRKRHTFGGVVFEETGKTRTLMPGEWGLRHGLIQFSNAEINNTVEEYAILRHVEP